VRANLVGDSAHFAQMSFTATTVPHKQRPQERRFTFVARREYPREFASPSGIGRSRLVATRPEGARFSGFAHVVEPEAPLPKGVVYKVADKPRERVGAFRLAYDAYVTSGLMRPNRFQLRVMPHHLLPTTATFVALREARVIATVSLVADGRLGLPLERVYPTEVNRLRAGSAWLGEVSALASSAAEAGSDFDVVVALMRLMAQFSQRQGLDHLLVAVHPRHARFYRRAMGFQPLGQERPYPAVCNRPAVALHLDLARLDSAPLESVALFFGEPIPDEQLRFCPISAAERRRFERAVANNVADGTSSGGMRASA
jgi:hypothetical protein